MTLELLRHLKVFTRRKHYNKYIWLQIGKAIRQADGRMEIFLDVVPLDGKFVIAEESPQTQEMAYAS